MTDYTRGNAISFKFICLDPDGNPMTPVSAVMKLIFQATGTKLRTTATVTMTIAANIVTLNWDSSVADVGPVFWSAKLSGTNNIVQDGTFTLTANAANV